jgi:hypothetical protein
MLSAEVFHGDFTISAYDNHDHAYSKHCQKMTLTPTRSLVKKISASSPPIAQDFTQAIGSVPIVRLNQVSPQC